MASQQQHNLPQQGTPFVSEYSCFKGSKFVPNITREHIRWKPTPPFKLWKLQFEPHDVDPRKDLWKVGGVMCKTHER
jgi:hypothetical protein